MQKPVNKHIYKNTRIPGMSVQTYTHAPQTHEYTETDPQTELWSH